MCEAYEFYLLFMIQVINDKSFNGFLHQIPWKLISE